MTYYPARRADMKLIWLGSCGHIVFNAGQVEGDHCYACDPDYEQISMGITWQKLYVKRDPKPEGASS